MSHVPPPVHPVSYQKPPKSKVTLYLGLACFFVALLGGVLVVWGSSRISSGVGDLADQARTLDPANDPTRTVVDLNVPGETVCTLKAGEYVIWAKVPSDARTRPADRDETEDGDDDANTSGSNVDEWDDETLGPLIELPPVTWTILDESQAEVPVDSETDGFFADEVQAARLAIDQPAEYTIRAEIDELPAGYSFRLCDDVTEKKLEQAAESVGNVAGGFMLIFAGGAFAGLFGLIGLILIIVYLAT